MDDSSTREEIAWYPSPPPSEIPASHLSESDSFPLNYFNNENDDLEPFCNGDLQYASVNVWSDSICTARRDACRRHRPLGVKIVSLPNNHLLFGEKGLFANQKFKRFDLLGEYTGKIVDDEAGGHYVAILEDRPSSLSLGVDAANCGNEFRFVNSYLNIDFEPNLTMRTVYIDTYPHLILVCTRDIELGEEFLLDYGEAYNEAYLSAKPVMDAPSPSKEVDLHVQDAI